MSVAEIINNSLSQVKNILQTAYLNNNPNRQQHWSQTKRQRDEEGVSWCLDVGERDVTSDLIIIVAVRVRPCRAGKSADSTLHFTDKPHN